MSVYCVCFLEVAYSGNFRKVKFRIHIGLYDFEKKKFFKQRVWLY